jgi:hypothetical protein
MTEPSPGEPGRAGSAELVSVTTVSSRAEAEMVRGLLRSDGIPSIHQRAAVLPGSKYGGAMGSHRVLVRATDAEEARELLADVESESESVAAEPVNARYLDEARGSRPRDYGIIGAYGRMFFWALASLAAVFALFLLVRVL